MRTVEEDVRAFLSFANDKTLKKIYSKFSSSHNDDDTNTREIFFNQELPDSFIDPKTNKSKIIYPRNKVRTTKYTPLNFIPMNIFFQFTNIANSYFLFIIILGCFQIFGVQSPGMQAVPLIVIVVLTAFKDAFEDYRRAISDYEMNNSKVHKLFGISNFNSLDDNISAWRKFKKFCSRSALSFLKLFVCGRKRNHNSNTDSDIDQSSLDLFTLRSITSNTLNSEHQSIDTNGKQNPYNDKSFPLKFKNTQWKNILVGDVLRIKKNEEIPSDVLILKSSNSNGNCYVETKNLDGETNLKTRFAMNFTNSKIKRLIDLTLLKFKISCEKPNKNLYSFHANIDYNDYDNLSTEKSESASINNILLRGSVLRNTNYVICIVLATGNETKIMLNSGVTPTKKSKISKNLNYFVLINFFLLFILCFVSGLVNGLFYRKSSNVSRLFFEYEPYSPTAAGNGTLTFFVVLIMYQTLVPISLYISIEIIKTIHAYFIYSDVNMYYPKLDFPCMPKSWGISDDLGQIEYIFSDKTGTLTQNLMEFKKCAIHDNSYGLAYTSAQEGMDKRNGLTNINEKITNFNKLVDSEKSKMIEKLSNLNPFFKEKNLSFISNDFVNELDKNKDNHDFLLALALCHNAIVEFPDIDNEDDDDFDISYSAESPDEVALVSFARDMGVVFTDKENDEYLIYDNGKQLRFKVLCVIPFTSARKRMSIVLKDSQNNIKMYMKGADNVILDRCIKGDYDNSIKMNLEEYSNEGLRTLCVSYKDLNEDEFYSWFKDYEKANKLIDEQREIQLNILCNQLENDFKLIGATAIDDKLQDSVPNTIESLRKAGIKCWVLTGDKIETAISIGYSCSMLNNNMKLLKIQANNIDELKNLIETYLFENFNLNPDDPINLKEIRKDHTIPEESFALLIDGKTLELLFDNCSKEIQLKFLILGKKCCSVLCCRVSPSQKADIVKLVKNNLQVVTLAIGDGANDVSMIQAANVGVGIAGEEGRQAAMSSDYAIGQFKYLSRLLLVHGKWSYQRLSIMIPCFFYKNVIFVMPLFWYGIFTDFDGTYLYEYTFLMLFNLFFTSVPVITLATMDQDIPDYISMAIPQLYRAGIKNDKKYVYLFLIYMIDGLYQSVISFFFPWLIFRTASFATHNGLGIDQIFSVGTFAIHISILSCNLYIMLKQRRWDPITVSLNFLSDLLLFIWVCGWSSSRYSLNYYEIGLRVYQNASFWACLFIGILSCILPGFAIDLVRINFFPNDVDKIRKVLNIGFIEKRKKTDIENDLKIANEIGGLEKYDSGFDIETGSKSVTNEK